MATEFLSLDGLKIYNNKLSSTYAKLNNANTFTQLQLTSVSNKNANTGKIAVFDSNGWLYYRTPAEVLTEAGGATFSVEVW